MGRLDNKVAIVSGGARGMGESHARAIVSEGGKVVIGDVLDDIGEALAAELGDAAVFVHLDVTQRDQWDAAVALGIEKFGKINVLVNNAGIANFGTLEDYTREQWDTIIGINLTGPFLGLQATVRELKRSAPSSIINISSTAGITGSEGQHGYSASKFGVRGITKTAAAELGPFNVRSNSIHPGPIVTPMSAGLDLSAIAGVLGKMGQPYEVSSIVVLLASDESGFCTGAEFVVDGGLVGTAGGAPEAD